MLNKRCPHCQKMVSIEDLKKQNSHKNFINREPVSCPHCQHTIVLPASAEKLISIGLLFSVILAPLIYYWLKSNWANTSLATGILFGIGIILLVMGILKNQPKTVSTVNQDNSHEKK